MDLLDKATRGERLIQGEIEALYDLPLPDLAAAAHQVRVVKTNPNVVTYLIDRNINYSNLCTIGCNFCAFYRTSRQNDAYVLSYEEVSEKVRELESVGGRRILMQGGVNPDLPFDWYLDLLRFLKSVHPGVRIDAFSPEEILGLERLTKKPAQALLEQLKAAGLDGLPGAGGEILVDEVRHRASPARIGAEDWFRILDVAQRLDLYTLASMVIGFGESHAQRALHLSRIRAQQDKAKARGDTGFSAFAMWTLQTEHTRLKGKVPGATAHEYLQQVAVARLALDNIENQQASWPTLGFKVAQTALYYGANDFGSTMLEEKVVSAASGHTRTHATEREIVREIVEAGFTPAVRDVFYNIEHFVDSEAILSQGRTQNLSASSS